MGEPLRDDPVVAVPLTIWWRAGQEPLPVQGAAELNACLADAERDVSEPTMVELRSPAGAWLGIGVGAPVSVATFDASAEGPNFGSDGDGSGEGESVFFFDGHWTEFSLEDAIPVEAAGQAAQEFLATGARPEVISWTEV